VPARCKHVRETDRQTGREIETEKKRQRHREKQRQTERDRDREERLTDR